MRDCLLIGNGLNRINNPEKGWGNILQKVANDLNVDLSNVDDEDYTSQFEYMVNYINSSNNDEDFKGGSTYTDVKNRYVKEINASLVALDKDICETINDIILDYIITTNYDVNLETCLCNLEKYRVPKGITEDRKEKREIFTKTNKTKWAIRNKDLYHIHGIETNPSSICLGFEHYSYLVSVLYERLYKSGKDEKIPIIKYLEDMKNNNESNYEFKDEFEVKFFDSNISIVGFELSSSEIDIWWLLIIRAYLYFANICGSRKLIENTIKYYDILSKKDIKEGENIESVISKKTEKFDKLHIKYIPIEIEDWSEVKKAYNDIFDKIGSDYGRYSKYMDF